MAIQMEKYKAIINELDQSNCRLVAVSKTKPVEDIMALYELGQRDFGENYVQEMVEKQSKLPADIRWHFIGHLQRNKVKNIAPFVHLIQGVDSLKLLEEINKQGLKNNRIIHCLLQVFIADEATKFGLNDSELYEIVNELRVGNFQNIKVVGLMGMASLTDDLNKVYNEFKYLKEIFDQYQSISTNNFHLQTLSMGMSGDYKTAIEAGSNMVRIGSLLFGERNYAPKN